MSVESMGNEQLMEALGESVLVDNYFIHQHGDPVVYRELGHLCSLTELVEEGVTPNDVFDIVGDGDDRRLWDKSGFPHALQIRSNAVDSRGMLVATMLRAKGRPIGFRDLRPVVGQPSYIALGQKNTSRSTQREPYLDHLIVLPDDVVHTDLDYVTAVQIGTRRNRPVYFQVHERDYHQEQDENEPGVRMPKYREHIIPRHDMRRDIDLRALLSSAVRSTLPRQT